VDAVLVILAVFSVPLVGIISSSWLKYKKMQLDAGAASPETARKLRLLEQQNDELRQRVETLETIATGMGATGMSLEGAQKLKELEAHKER
jgi:hypothetical protein